MAFVFYAYPMQMLKSIDTLTSGISNEVMDGPYKAAVGGGDVDAKAKASSLCWNLLFISLGRCLNFGKIDTASKYEDDILKLKPDSDDRKKLVADLADKEGLFSKSASYQGERLTTAIIFLLFNIILMAVLLIFSVLILAYQFLLIFYLMLGIFVFLCALLPSFGMPLVERWAYRVVGVAFTKVLVVFFLSVALVFMQVIYGFTEQFGLFITVFIMLVLMGAIWFERYRFLDLFTGMRSDINHLPQTVKKGIDYDGNPFQGIQHIRRNSIRQIESLSTDSVDSKSPDDNRTTQRSNQGNSQGIRMTVKPDERSRRTYEQIDQAGDKMNESADKIRTASQDMGTYFKVPKRFFKSSMNSRKQNQKWRPAKRMNRLSMTAL